MTDVFVVRSEFGKFTDHFVKGGYVGGGWMSGEDLSGVREKTELERLYRSTIPSDVSPHVVGNYVGQIATFLLEIKEGDYVITPTSETEWLRYGKMEASPSYYYSPGDSDGCPYAHRRRVSWAKRQLRRSEFSVPFQNTLRASMTAFRVSHTQEFLVKIGEEKPVTDPAFDPYGVVLDRILKLDSREFELLVGSLLAAIGFEGTVVVGGPGDGGLDVRGELDVSNLAKVKLFVQAKRYNVGSTVRASEVLKLRQVIPNDGQGAFITTSDFQASAKKVADEPGFQRIGLINGRQLVDLLAKHWGDIDEDFQTRLGLRPGLVPQ